MQLRYIDSKSKCDHELFGDDTEYLRQNAGLAQIQMFS